MQDKEIDINDIIQSFNRNSINNQHISYRLSDDYQPNYNRYSREDELQQITFHLSNEDLQAQMDSFSQNQVGIKEENPMEKLSFILQEEKQQTSKPITSIKQLPKQKKISLSRKKSIEASERLKKKISLKKQSDQFTKKYDDLFDEIFFKQKKRDPLGKQSAKQQESLNETTHETPRQSSPAEQNHPLSIKNVLEQTLMSVSRKGQNQCSMDQLPRIVILQQLRINIIPPKQHQVVQPQNPTLKGNIKFSYGNTQAPTPITRIVQIPQNKLIKSEKKVGVPFGISEQQRIPIFLVPFRSKTNSYPNFYNKKYFTLEACQQINQQFSQMVNQCKKSIQILKQSHLKLHDYFDDIRDLYKNISENIIVRNSAEDKKLLEFFLSKDWPNYIKAGEVSIIRPRDYFLGRTFYQLQFMTFLNSFDEVMAKTQKEGIVYYNNSQSISKYMSSRDYLWGIEKNLRLMSEDLYIYSISHFNLPSHILDTYRMLKLVERKEPVQLDGKKLLLRSRLLFLKEKKDFFGNSWLGNYAIQCIDGLPK